MTILFVCSGNTCRSPMAMALFRLEKTDIQAESAGISAQNGQPASMEAIRACQILGADLTKHKSRRITPEMINDADIIAAMTSSHKMQLLLAGCPPGENLYSFRADRHSRRYSRPVRAKPGYL